MKKQIAIVIVTLAASGAGWPQAAAFRMTRPEKSLRSFARDAGGRQAAVSAEWRIVPQRQLGKIIGVALCGDDEAFLLDRQFETVHRVDLNRGTIVASIGQGLATDPLFSTTSVAADCARRTLYVMEHLGVVAFDMDSGAVTRRFSKPARFSASVGSAILDGDGRTLYVPGVWGSSDGNWLLNPMDRMFDGAAIGYRLDLRTGRTAPMMPAVERGCWSLGPNCVFATLDAVGGAAGAGWIAAHRVGRMVGVYDASFRLVRTIDVRSRLFLESGFRNESHVTSRGVAWNEDNSVIRFVYGFGDAIATVHSYNRTRGWRPGMQTDFNVFLNVHGLAGDRLVSDVGLPDLPVGRDATSLYVIDYGPGGRRMRGADPITLLRIPVDQ